MSGFSFPTTGPTTGGGFSFSAPASVTSPSQTTPNTKHNSFCFGITPTVSSIATTTNPTFNFGTNPISSSAAPAFNFNTSSAATAPTFNFNTTTSNTQLVPSLGLTTTPAVTTTAASLAGNPGGFNLSTSQSKPHSCWYTTTTVQQLKPFSTVSSAPSFTLPFGNTTTGFTPATTTATTTSAGLGGITLTSQQKSEQKTDIVAVKENKVPQEILSTVEDLKSYIKQQKTISSEIARTSVRKLSNVSNDIESLNYKLQEISDSIQSNYLQIRNLRNETSKAIQNVEMAKHTAEIPASLQFENTAPLKYFQELVQKYENDLILLRNQIELTERQMKSVTQPRILTPEDLKRGLKHIYECFVALAGRLHDIHRKVETVKEEYLILRRKLNKDENNPFVDIDNDGKESNISKIGAGPSPFSMLASLGKYNTSSNIQGTGTAGGGVVPGTQSTGISSGLSGTKTIGFGADQVVSSTPFSAPLFNTSGVGGISTTSTTGEGLNLQKPPLGAKRNKQ